MKASNSFLVGLSVVFLSACANGGSEAELAKSTSSKLNRLGSETSPYLKQHADNPVDWYPWGEEAFQRAKREQKPILLSVGYSACHWCHVMEHESFEDPETARIMNENFINIKVDREERPDIDAIYMNALTRMTGGGGWPMTVFMTPELKPFFAGTYFPKTNKIGQPSFKRILNIVIKGWKEDRKNIYLTSNQVVEMISKEKSSSVASTLEANKLLQDGVSTLLYYADAHWGGLGHTTKFPYPTVLDLFMRSINAPGLLELKDRKAVRNYIELTLNKMALGGIHDQIGGGFSRYSTDSKWMIPHFEKMLYDNAMLANCYLDGYKITKHKYWASVAEDTLDFAIAELKSPDSFFYSSLDADSEGEEGKFYLLTPGDLGEALDGDDSVFAAKVFGVTEEGNFEGGRTVPHLVSLPEKLSKKLRLDRKQFNDKLETVKKKLLAYRNKRVRPGRDEKVLTGWNALMVSSMVNGYVTLEKPKYLEVAKDCASLLLSKQLKENVLLRTYSDGNSRIPAFLDDYAYTVRALLDLASVDSDPKWLNAAVKLNDLMMEKFYDSETGVFYYTESNKPDLIVRTKMHADGSTPSGTSVATMNLFRLARLLDNSEFYAKANRVIKYYAFEVKQKPANFSYLLSALSYGIGKKSEVVLLIDSKPGSNWPDASFQTGKFYLPNSLVLTTGTDTKSILSGSALLKGRELINAKPTAFVCENYTCQTPVNDLDSLAKSLNKLANVSN